LLETFEIVIAAGVFGVLGCVTVIAIVNSRIHLKRVARRPAELKAVADANGWEYQQHNVEISEQIVEALQPSTVFKFSLLPAKKFRPIELNSFLFLPDDGLVICDSIHWRTASRKPGSGNHHATLLYGCNNDVSMPHFGVIPKMAGDKFAASIGLGNNNQLSNSSFDSRYRLHAEDVVTVQHFFPAEVVAILAKRKNYILEGWGQNLVIGYSPQMQSGHSFFGYANDRRIGLHQMAEFQSFAEDAAALGRLIFQQAQKHSATGHQVE